MSEYSDVLSLLIQLPIVGLFIWVVFRMMKEHREEREQMTERFTASFDKASEAITDLNVTTQSFHTEVKEWRRERDRGV